MRSCHISVSENIRHRPLTIGGAALAEAYENRVIASVLHVPVPPFFEQGQIVIFKTTERSSRGSVTTECYTEHKVGEVECRLPIRERAECGVPGRLNSECDSYGVAPGADVRTNTIRDRSVGHRASRGWPVASTTGMYSRESRLGLKDCSAFSL
jgi:hypothetical protein